MSNQMVKFVRPLQRVIMQTSLVQKDFPEIGKIGLGVKDQSKGFPKDVPYFVFKDGPFKKRAHEVYGDKPTAIDVFFMTDTMTDFYDQAFRVWGSNGRLKCHSYDGCRAIQMDDQGFRHEVVCPWDEIFTIGAEPAPEDDCKIRKGKADVVQCKAQLRLSFCLSKVAPLQGVFSLYTGSKVAMGDLLTDLTHIQRIAGQLAHVPLVLYREEKKIRQPGSEKMATHWPLRIRFSDDVSNALTERYNEQFTFRLGRVQFSQPVQQTVIQAAPEMLQIQAPEPATEIIDKVTGEITTIAPEPEQAAPVTLLSAMTASKLAIMAHGETEEEASKMVIVKVAAYLQDYMIDFKTLDDIATIPPEKMAAIISDIEGAANEGTFPWANH